ncbi:WD40 repeat domain-containing protein, partial [Actinomadura rugatobispora]
RVPRRVPRRALLPGARAATAAEAAATAPALLLSRPDDGAPAKRPAPFTPTGTPSPTVLVGDPIAVRQIAFVDGDRRLLAAGLRTLWNWDLSTGQGNPVHMPEVLDYGADVLSPDGRLVAGAVDTHIALADPATGRTTGRIDLPGDAYALALTTDGATLASARDGATELWDVRTRRKIGTAFDDGLNHLAFSPDGRLLAGGKAYRGPIRVWDTAAGRSLTELYRGHSPMALAFSPDGTMLAGSTDPGAVVHLWDTRTWRETRTLRGHTGYVEALAFSPDGGTLATGSKDKTIRLWNARTGASLATLTVDTDSVDALAFSRDGRSMASATGSGTIRLWRFP